MLKPKEDREISQGFPWVYDNEISTVKFPLEEGMKTSSLGECAVEDGTIVEVYSNAGGFLCPKAFHVFQNFIRMQ